MKHTGLGKFPKNYVIYIEKGEKVNATIEEFCKSHEIIHASYTGIGAVTNVEVAIYHPSQKKYARKKFSDEYELTSLHGNFGFIKNEAPEDKWFAHTHVTFSDNDFQCYGGHLDEAEVMAVVEIYIKGYTKELTRAYNDDIGLNVMNIHCNHDAQGEGSCGCNDDCCGHGNKQEGSCCQGHGGHSYTPRL